MSEIDSLDGHEAGEEGLLPPDSDLFLTASDGILNEESNPPQPRGRRRPRPAEEPEPEPIEHQIIPAGPPRQTYQKLGWGVKDIVEGSIIMTASDDTNAERINTQLSDSMRAVQEASRRALQQRQNV